MMDPDKKVEDIQKERPSLYQSHGYPEHFGTEGEEYSDLYSEFVEEEEFIMVEKNIIISKQILQEKEEKRQIS